MAQWKASSAPFYRTWNDAAASYVTGSRRSSPIPTYAIMPWEHIEWWRGSGVMSPSYWVMPA